MEFLFFDAADNPIFSRSDAESAEWTQEDFQLHALFPYDAGKPIHRGMRIGFTDDMGVFQPFEIRKVRNYEPDHYQELTCEHIAVSELTDVHFAGAELTNTTAQSALTMLLTGSGWSVGNSTAVNLSSADLGMGSVWQSTRTIEQNWNVYITPRVTFGPSGITGRYLDIAPAQGVWRGLMLSLDKNADEMGVTVDDTETLTALYGYGANTESGTPLTFASVTWQQTEDHPAKPAGRTYLEDPYSTQQYGRNGRARFGFYQNSDITDPEILLEKTWEALKATYRPKVSIDCMISDLYRLGYADQPIRLHDQVIVEIRPLGEKQQLEVIRLTVNLLDPTATRPTIGAYIPNIIYMQRQTAENAAGSAADTTTGRRGGGGGGGGGSALQNKIKEFETEIARNDYQISLRAYQRDMDNVEEILRQAGVSINAQGVLIYADDNPNMLGARFEVQAGQISSLVSKTGVDSLGGAETLYSRIVQNEGSITSEVTRATGAEGSLSSRITQNADSISLVVSNGSINAASIVASINSAGSSVKISADNIELDGPTVASYLYGQTIEVSNLTVGSTATIDSLTVSNELDVSYVDADTVSANSMEVGGADVADAVAGFGTATASGGQITIPTTKLDGTSGPPINFNIADTQFYQDGVSAAKASMGVTGTWDDNVFTYRVIQSSTKSESVTVTADVSAVYNSTTHQYTCVGSAVADGSYIASASTGSGTAAYDAGKAAMGMALNGSVINLVEGGSAIRYSITAVADITYNSSSHTYTADATAKVSGTTAATDAWTSGTEAYDDGYADGQASMSVTGSDIRLGSSSSSTGALTKTATEISGYIWWNSPSGWDSLRYFSISTGMVLLDTILYYRSSDGTFKHYTAHNLYYKS